MAFFTIPYNEGLMAELSAAAARDHLTGSYLLCGSGDRMAAARYLTAAMECHHPEKAPCGQCEGCRKVMEQIHPDVTYVDDPEHVNYALSIIRGIASDAYILPNEGRRKIYVIPDCDRLEIRGQNTLLKVLEEGPHYASFLFLSDNPSKVLPTVRSRLGILRVLPKDEETAAPHPDAVHLCSLIESGNSLSLAGFFAQLETNKLKREDLKTILTDAYTLVGHRAEQTAGKERRRLYLSAKVLEQAAEELRFHLGVGHAAMAVAVKLSRLMSQSVLL